MTITISIVIIGAIFGLVAVGYEMTAFAAKPDGSNGSKDVIASSNGFPSGQHFNLIIHGKSSFDDCGGSGGHSVFTPEYSPSEEYPGDQTLQYYINKKAHSTTLTVRDRCTDGFDGDPAQVQLPTEFEDGTKITDGFWVFARVHGTPDNGKNGGDSNIVLTPDPKIEACNLNDEADGTESDCVDSNGNQADVVELGFVTKNGVYKCDETDPDIIDCDEKLYRYDAGTPGKGAKKAIDMTPLFLWSGIACEDLDGDGELTFDDFDTDSSGTIDAGEGLTNSGDSITAAHIATALAVSDTGVGGVIDTDADFNALLTVIAEAGDYDGCVSETDLWVFNLFDADLVIQNQTLTNDGVKNLQIRFYPQQTTTFTPAYDVG